MSKKITNSLDQEHEWDSWIGKEIIKFSKKKFKSGENVVIPIGIEINPFTNKKAFLLADECTLVDCFKTHLYIN